jgi:FkbM family methyltransferase
LVFNPIERTALARFRWQPVTETKEFILDALGGKTKWEYYAGIGWTEGQAASSGLFGPVIHEELFEWIDVAETVLRAHDKYTFIELGCGYARWIVFAALALKQQNPLPASWIGLDPEPSHYRWALEHLRDNGVSNARIIQAAVGATDGEANFFIGAADAWYGQYLAPEALEPTTPAEHTQRLLEGKKEQPLETISRVKMVSLTSVLAPLDRVDLIDCDVQGAELEVVMAAAEAVDNKVSRFHVGTHTPEAEEGLRELFRGLGWRKLSDYGVGKENETPFGMITFVDGVQSWANPRYNS